MTEKEYIDLEALVGARCALNCLSKVPRPEDLDGDFVALIRSLSNIVVKISDRVNVTE